MQSLRPFESSRLGLGREMSLSPLTCLKSCSDCSVDESPSAAKLIEPKFEGKGPTLHPFHMHEQLGVRGGFLICQLDHSANTFKQHTFKSSSRHGLMQARDKNQPLNGCFVI